MPAAIGLTANGIRQAAEKILTAPQMTAGPPADAARSPWPVRLYQAALITIAAALAVTYVPQFEGAVGVFLFLLVLTVLVERIVIVIYGETYISVGFVIMMAVLILYGPPGIVIAAPVGALASRIGRRPLDATVLANASLFIVVNTTAFHAYNLVAEQPPSAGLNMVVGAGLASIAALFVNACLLTVGVALKTGQRLSSMWSNHHWLLPHYIAMGMVGAALALATIALGVIGILAFLTPALMMRVSMKQYVDKTTEHVEQLKKQNQALWEASIHIQRVSDELLETYNGTLEALVTALDARDQETKGHSVRVARYMLNIAGALGVPEGSDDWVNMQRGALLHDVGKIGVRDSILLKPGKLTAEEWEEMRRHPEIGYNMLKEVRFLAGAAEIVRAHHERWDGKGYPRGLKEGEIPLGSRIFSVVDTFDSMTSDRPYRRALEAQEALNEILRCSGTQFDPRVVEAFLDIYDDWVREMAALRDKSFTAA
jgi:putative nucleotidyltransferase with HDIG domain